MISFSQDQLVAWMSPLLWPFVRALALFMAAPVLSSRAVPARAKIGLAFLVALGCQASLSGQPVVGLDSPQALAVLLQQIFIGLAIGFAVRIVFASVELAGELMGLQMGLSFASFFDPVSNAQVSAIARLFTILVTLMFVAVNGHLLLVVALVNSFQVFPVDAGVMQAAGQLQIHRLGAELFSTALWIALPMIALMLFVNLTLGIISRIAPQINIFAIGFPVTLAMGMVGLVTVIPLLDAPILAALDRVLALFGTST